MTRPLTQRQLLVLSILYDATGCEVAYDPVLPASLQRNSSTLHHLERRGYVRCRIDRVELTKAGKRALQRACGAGGDGRRP